MERTQYNIHMIDLEAVEAVYYTQLINLEPTQTISLQQLLEL